LPIITTRFLSFFAMAAIAAGWQTASTPAPKVSPARRLFVEPFTTEEGSEKLRDDLISELRRLGNVPLAANAQAADVILGGGGEIWIRGYRSLNPRSGPSPANGTPVYGGYLAVELRDLKGETLWSYLVTPSAVDGDISKNLAKQIAKHVVEALRQDAVLPNQVESAQPAATLKGAGATFPYPLYTKWFTNYRRANQNVAIAYEAIGSEGGVRRLLAGDLDFAGSDSPEAVAALAPTEESKYLYFPTAVGAVVPIVNLPGVTGQIAFTPEALAGIYQGTIRKWNDPAVQRANPHIRLPDLDIVVVHRSDGSGTSYVWTDYLSKISPEFGAKIGTRLDPAWPIGKAASGNEGVAGMVKELGGSIGYVEFIYALKNHLSFGKVRNRDGEFVAASLESIGIAAGKAAEMGSDLKISIVNAPGSGAYPISSFTWLVVPAHISDETKRTALTGFLTWMLGPGQAQAATLGYLGLPKEVIDREEAAVTKIR
jgi:phosphate transport system substrate-binding protein